MPGYGRHFSSSRYNAQGHSRTISAVFAPYRHWQEPRSIHGTNVVAPVLSHGNHSPQRGKLTAVLRVVNATAQCLPAPDRYNAQRYHQGTNGGQSGQCHHAMPSLRRTHRAHPWEVPAQSSRLTAHTISTDARRPTAATQSSASRCRYDAQGHSRTKRAVFALYRQCREPWSIHGTNISPPVLPHDSPSPQPGHPLMAVRPDNATAQRPPTFYWYTAHHCHRSTSSGCSRQSHRVAPSPHCTHHAHPWEAPASPSRLAAHTISTDTRRPTVATQSSASRCRYDAQGHSRTKRAVFALYRQWRKPRLIRGTNVVVPVLSHGSHLSEPGHPLMATRPSNATPQCLPVFCRYNAQRYHRGTNGGQCGQCHSTALSLRCTHRAYPWGAPAQPSGLTAHSINKCARRSNVVRRQSTSQCRYNAQGHSRTKRAVFALYRQWRKPRSVPSTNTVSPGLASASPSPQPGTPTAPPRVVNAAAQRPPAPGLASAPRRLDQVTPALPQVELPPYSAYARSWFIKAKAQCLPMSCRYNRPSYRWTKDAGCAVYGPGQSAAITRWSLPCRSLVTDCVSPRSAHCTHCQNRSLPRSPQRSLPCSTQQRAYSGATLRAGCLRQSPSVSTDNLLCAAGLPWLYNAAAGQAVDWQVVQCTVMGSTVYFPPYNAHTVSHEQVVQRTVIGKPVHPAPYNAHTVSHRQLVQCTVMGQPAHPAPYNAHAAWRWRFVQRTVMGLPPRQPRLSAENTGYANGQHPLVARRWARCTGPYFTGTATTAHAAASHYSRGGLTSSTAFVRGF